MTKLFGLCLMIFIIIVAVWVGIEGEIPCRHSDKICSVRDDDPLGFWTRLLVMLGIPFYCGLSVWRRGKI